MVDRKISLDETGNFPQLSLETDQKHTVIVDVLELDHRYHDNEGLFLASFVLKSDLGLEYHGQLDSKGKATVIGVPPGKLSVRFGPDSRNYQPVIQAQSSAYQATLSREESQQRLKKLLGVK